MAEVAPLYLNWLQAWADAQRPDGGLPHTAPNPYKAGGGPYWCSFPVQAAWRTFMNYGDKRPLERFYPVMKHWLDYVDAYSVDGLLKTWPTPVYRWWYLGDWAAPAGVDVQDPASIDLVANCTLCQVYLELEQIARVLGQDADAPEFRARYDALRQRIQEALYHDGVYASGSQVDLVFPLLTGVVPEELRDEVVETLKTRTQEVYGGHLATGLVGVPVITEWARRHRRLGRMGRRPEPSPQLLQRHRQLVLRGAGRHPGPGARLSPRPHRPAGSGRARLGEGDAGNAVRSHYRPSAGRASASLCPCGRYGGDRRKDGRLRRICAIIC